MRNLTFILLCTFYITCLLSGYTPYIYESDFNSFVANQFFWVFIFIICYCLASYKVTKQHLIVIRSLILLSAFEMIDEILNLNSYLPMTITRVLKLDATVNLAVTLFTIYKLYKSCQITTLQKQ